jgi:hypothetical protein
LLLFHYIDDDFACRASPLTAAWASATVFHVEPVRTHVWPDFSGFDEFRGFEEDFTVMLPPFS